MKTRQSGRCLLYMAIFFFGFQELHAQSGPALEHARQDTLPEITANHQTDSAFWKNNLGTVVVTAYEQNKKLVDQPTPVAYLSGRELDRYDDTRLLSAINAVPGVRLEERSPGSYRLNIRGSSLRSPFGVRNVKIYYDGVPFTDPGGNTYLNQLSFDDYGSLEIIKGPAGSLYGAGTGGTVLIQSPLFSGPLYQEPSATLRLEGGSFNQRKISASVRWGGQDHANEVRYSHFSTNGYRDQTAMHSDVASYEMRLKATDRQELSAFFHYTDLYYQTPGALTLSEYQKNPRAARPASGIHPGAEESKAAVYQKAFFTGLKSKYRISDHFDNNTVVYGSYTDFTNPTTRNYEYRKEPHFGGRTVFHFHPDPGKVTANFWMGAEAQQGFFSQKDFQNAGGVPDALQTATRINDFVGLLFAQGDLSFRHGWDLTAGLSMYHEDLRFSSLYPLPYLVFNKKYHEVLSPRIALSKKITPGILVYLNVSRGFSPPSVSEILPSTTVLNTALQAEEGIDYELGSKGSLAEGKLYYDVSAYLFSLTQSITVRRDSSGADYFVNSGSALEKGVEASLNYILFHHPGTFLSDANIWLSGSYTHFKYTHYRSEDKDYSGNILPGTAPLTLASGLDINTRIGLRAYVTWQRTSRIALDDANSVYAPAYNLLGAKISYSKDLAKKIRLILSVAGDNLLNEKYSLGNDINAAGGRYYNAAPTANGYLEVGLRFLL